ncbi:hypothetical protein SAMN06269185_1603 [Natronoarchaeum philippinense]|uniref:Uncharacterized protein n=1 Tax=Natronoarchaeum philippinense TaxID=558529 RepID=A0A285NTH5_NATPI|nr:hypothetical protein SAMN06269185_1603 [Natronoarchaeum philippinense]
MASSQLKVNQPTTRERSHPKAPPKRPGANLRGYGTGLATVILFPRLNRANRITYVNELTNTGQHFPPVQLTANNASVTVRADEISHLLT